MSETASVTELVIPEEITQRWQKIVDMIAELTDVPSAMIMRLMGPDIEVFISSKGEGNPFEAGDRELFEDSGLYCEAAIKNSEMLVVSNALKDEDWCDNLGREQGMISYMGIPLLLPNGQAFGTICVMDRKENEYSDTFKDLITNFREIIEGQLELIYANLVLGEEKRSLSEFIQELKVLRGIVPICSHCKKIRDSGGSWNEVDVYVGKHTDAEFSHGICPDCLRKYYPDFADDL